METKIIFSNYGNQDIFSNHGNQDNIQYLRKPR